MEHTQLDITARLPPGMLRTLVVKHGSSRSRFAAVAAAASRNHHTLYSMLRQSTASRCGRWWSGSVLDLINSQLQQTHYCRRPIICGVCGELAARNRAARFTAAIEQFAEEMYPTSPKIRVVAATIHLINGADVTDATADISQRIQTIVGRLSLRRRTLHRNYMRRKSSLPAHCRSLIGPISIGVHPVPPPSPEEPVRYHLHIAVALHYRVPLKQVRTLLNQVFMAAYADQSAGVKKHGLLPNITDFVRLGRATEDEEHTANLIRYQSRIDRSRDRLWTAEQAAAAMDAIYRLRLPSRPYWLLKARAPLVCGQPPSEFDPDRLRHPIRLELRGQPRVLLDTRYADPRLTLGRLNGDPHGDTRCRS